MPTTSQRNCGVLYIMVGNLISILSLSRQVKQRPYQDIIILKRWWITVGCFPKASGNHFQQFRLILVIQFIHEADQRASNVRDLSNYHCYKNVKIKQSVFGEPHSTLRGSPPARFGRHRRFVLIARLRKRWAFTFYAYIYSLRMCVSQLSCEWANSLLRQWEHARSWVRCWLS